MRLLKLPHSWIFCISHSFPRRLRDTHNLTLRLRHSLAHYHMNRPRNRQQRPPRDQNRGGRHGDQPRSRFDSVPTVQQVTPGASVSIVLKEDQPTGREVQGVVQDLLTRGNHPRGIKVRLTDGRVGRVQRLAASIPNSSSLGVGQQSSHQTPNSTGNVDGPPTRSLADYLPLHAQGLDQPPQPSKSTFTTATATCPICGLFEGDELAVSHHVDEHLE